VDLEQFDVIVIGAGVTGLYTLYRLRELGLSVRVYEEGGGVGGTWYWNRYPGARFDSESYTYGYSFSGELLQEWDWSEHYSGQPETERYFNFVADKFDLRRDIRFHSRVVSAVFDSADDRWQVELDDGHKARAQFLITAVGGLSARYIPNFEGLETFQGQWCHTGNWPKEGIELAGKRVGVIGTGATGVQVIPEIAKVASHLTVFQRTPNYCVPLRNGPIDPETQRWIKASFPEIFRRCDETGNSFMHQFDPRSAMEVSKDERLEQFERLWAESGFRKFLANFQDVMKPGPANEEYAKFVRQKIGERVKDPVLAEKLIPRDHIFGSKRVPCESGYYEVFNQDNVLLVDVRENPIALITPSGVKTAGAEYRLDVLIFATGYDYVTGALEQIEIGGLGGRTLADKWAGGMRTYMGIQCEGFPNLFTINAVSTGNFVRGVEPLVDWMADCICYVRTHGFRRISPTPESEAAWMQHVHESSAGSLLTKTDSWFVGANIPGKPRVLLISPDPAPTMRAKRAAIAASGYEGFQLE
jgi:cation diffusion facilitator CzcD-associated flavoprotein CzcO